MPSVDSFIKHYHVAARGSRLSRAQVARSATQRSAAITLISASILSGSKRQAIAICTPPCAHWIKPIFSLKRSMPCSSRRMPHQHPFCQRSPRASGTWTFTHRSHARPGQLRCTCAPRWRKVCISLAWCKHRNIERAPRKSHPRIASRSPMRRYPRIDRSAPSPIRSGQIDGVVVAEAALIRLATYPPNRLPLPGTTAPLQGRLAVLAREDDEEMKNLFSCIDAR